MVALYLVRSFTWGLWIDVAFNTAAEPHSHNHWTLLRAVRSEGKQSPMISIRGDIKYLDWISDISGSLGPYWPWPYCNGVKSIMLTVVSPWNISPRSKYVVWEVESRSVTMGPSTSQLTQFGTSNKYKHVETNKKVECRFKIREIWRCFSVQGDQPQKKTLPRPVVLGAHHCLWIIFKQTPG